MRKVRRSAFSLRLSGSFSSAQNRVLKASISASIAACISDSVPVKKRVIIL